ncbi:MAG: hypothetical protein LBP72_02095 [Dysgonamonadaceae bacterium]|jgi:hypothetical protein|nr:hypothetical protein [Dysgonamonadaceae bacterium]
MVTFHPSVVEYLDRLGKQLFDAGYFGFHDSAIRYIRKMVDYITVHLSTAPAKPAPDYFKKYGTFMQYITYNPNKQTTWYVFFQQKGTDYLIRYITNNHSEGQYIR